MKKLTDKTADRIKHYLKTVGSREPDEIFDALSHPNQGLVPFTLWTMLFSQDLHLNGFGEVCILTPDTREYLYEPVQVVPISRYRGTSGAPQRSYPVFDGAAQGGAKAPL